MENAEFTSNFTKFDPEAYLESNYSGLKWHPVYGGIWVREMQWFHEAFASNKIKGRRLLDIGSGPTIHTVITASDHVDSIFLSDFAPQNREYLRKWLDGTLEHSFESHFKYVVELEGKGETPKERELCIRKKVAGICHIDLLQQYPMAPSFFPKFDIITTALCLISVAMNHNMYETIARRIADMLVEGGHLVLFSVDAGNVYKVGSHLFRSLVIDSKTVRDIWKGCGFEIIEWKQESPPQSAENDVSLYFLMVAKKVKTP